MATDLAATLVDRQNPPAQGRRARPHALHGAFKTADDRWVLLFMPEPRWWPSFCEAVGRPQWVTDERFATIPARKQHMSELTDEMDQLFAERTLPSGAGCWTPMAHLGPGRDSRRVRCRPAGGADRVVPDARDAGGPRPYDRAPLSIAGAEIRVRGLLLSSVSTPTRCSPNSGCPRTSCPHSPPTKRSGRPSTQA